MYPRLAVLAGGLILLCTVPLAAQDAVLSQMYGSGVHAFFSRDYGQAYEHLTAAVDGGTVDPRCYYFRGLTFLQLGREEEAKLDFDQASQREAEDINKFYNVSRALERIQGSTRLLVEQYRVKARMEALQREEERREERYGKIRAEEKRVLDVQAEAAPATPPDVPAAPAPGTPTDPFGLGPTQATSVGPDDVPAKSPAAEPAEAPAAPAQEDPFAVPGPGMEKAPAATPPAEGPAAPAEAPAEASASGVFGAMQKAMSKAVGGEEAGDAAFPAPEQPAAEEKPEAPAPEQPAPADDPFGAPAAAAPAMPGADEEPAEEEPAAEEKPEVPAPKQPAAGDDPFGAPAAAPAMPAEEEQPAAEEKPEAEAAEAVDENPFMEEKADEAEGEKEAEAAPADDDPFGEKPAKE